MKKGAEGSLFDCASSGSGMRIYPSAYYPQAVSYMRKSICLQTYSVINAYSNNCAAGLTFNCSLLFRYFFIEGRYPCHDLRLGIFRACPSFDFYPFSFFEIFVMLEKMLDLSQT